MDERITIHPSSKIGNDFVIWPYSEIRENVIIGDSVSIGRNVYIAPGVKIGNLSRIQNNVCIYENSVIGDSVLIGPGTILTNDRLPRLIDEEGNRRTSGTWEPIGVEIANNVSLGANVTCVSGVRIDEWSIVGAGSVVTRNIPNFSLAYGNPATVSRRIGIGGERLLSEDGKTFFSVPAGRTYKITESGALQLELSYE
jgi:UDP-2-acetamido-3-amino-2,3-dideoxy-glucuronate N-acetyltransferase